MQVQELESQHLLELVGLEQAQEQPLPPHGQHMSKAKRKRDRPRTRAAAAGGAVAAVGVAGEGDGSHGNLGDLDREGIGLVSVGIDVVECQVRIFGEDAP